MKRTGTIQSLLKRFSDNNLTPQESKELLSVARSDDRDKELNAVLTTVWEEASDAELQAPTARMLSNIRKRMSEPSGPESAKSLKSSQFAWLVPALKYAAIVILSMCSAWLFRDFTLKNADKELTVADGKDVFEIAVPLGSKSRITLPDGSHVNLNSGSTLRYSSGSGNNSRMAYIEGEAYFNIKKDAGHPFYVKTNELTIKVLGTQFNVSSYTEEKFIKTTLISGSIEIYNNRSRLPGKSEPMVLKPNEQAVFVRADKQFASENIPEVNKKAARPGIIKPMSVQKPADIDPIISWKDNRLIFKDENFLDLTRKMERWFDVEIEIRDKELSSAMISGVFEKETVEQAINALQLATPFRYEINKNRIILTK